MGPTKFAHCVVRIVAKIRLHRHNTQKRSKSKGQWLTSADSFCKRFLLRRIPATDQLVPCVGVARSTDMRPPARPPVLLHLTFFVWSVLRLYGTINVVMTAGNRLCIAYVLLSFCTYFKLTLATSE